MNIRKIFYAIFLFGAVLSPLPAQPGEDYITLSKDGAWCWFSDPRGIVHEGKLYSGWTSSSGNVVVGTYDYLTGDTATTIIYPHLQKDDHTAPSLLFLPDNRLMVFFNRHNGGFYCTTSLQPNSISGFGPVKFTDLGKMMCYTNPVMLSRENNQIYLFFRGGTNWKPSFIFSDDLGKSWSSSVTMVAKPGASVYNRPYTKVVSDGKSAIHFAFTDGHPRNEICNSIYYLKYENGKFFNAAGKMIGDTAHLPIDQNVVPKVYDGEDKRVRAWIWDIALTKDKRPVMVYATFPEDAKHIYNYAVWDGKEWKNSVICRGGSWFPRYDKKKEENEPEPHYSGGLVLDHGDPAVVYLSKPVNDRFEIFKYITPDEGGTWKYESVTLRSNHDNVRPYVVRDNKNGESPHLLWMNIIRYRHYSDFYTRIIGDKLLPTGRSAQISGKQLLK